ncbi:DUF4232 domain-containing protein [Streptomyces sp. NPDC048442]|uniref:DUF4232 domain-containing protein n=1 Tax=Streptomyces sp. NPDC048442 TaxID=3154823 RepID=UPI00343F8EE3
MRISARRPAILAATAFAALSLSLTACGGGNGTKDAGAGATAPVGSSASDSAGKKDTAAGTGGASGEADKGTGGSDTSGSGTSGSATAGSGKPGSASGGATQTGSKSKSGGKAPACGYNDVQISAEKQDGPPYTHITLTAKNTSGHSCTMEKYPLIAFGEIQTAKDVPAVAKSKPPVAVVLEPGAPAYAAVRVNNGGQKEDGHAVSSFNVNLFTGGAPTEGSKQVSVKDGIQVTDKFAKTGYWTYELRNGADDF